MIPAAEPKTSATLYAQKLSTSPVEATRTRSACDELELLEQLAALHLSVANHARRPGKGSLASGVPNR